MQKHNNEITKQDKTRAKACLSLAVTGCNILLLNEGLEDPVADFDQDGPGLLLRFPRLHRRNI